MSGGGKVGGVNPNPIQFDVNQRDLALRPGTGKSIDQEYQSKYENLELNLFSSAGRNFVQTGRDLGNVISDAANAAVGYPELSVGLLVGIVGNFDDVSWTAYHAVGTAAGKIDLMDKTFVEQLDKQGITGDKRAALEARWATTKIHAAEIVDGKEWALAADGLQRIGNGIIFGFADGGSAIKNFGDGVVQTGAGIAVGGTKGFAYLVGKGLGYVLEYAGAAIEWAGGKVAAGGNQLEERANQIYSNSPEARAIEARAQF